MGWFNRSTEPKADPIGSICELLVDRWWEWGTARVEQLNSDNIQLPGLKHLSGVVLAWETSPAYASVQVYMSPGNARLATTLKDESKRLYRAILAFQAAKIKSARGTFDTTAEALAKSVLETKDRTAARMLADRIIELCNEGE